MEEPTSCDELERLLDTYTVASHRYKMAVNDLSILMGRVPKEEYMKLRAEAEEADRAATAARRAVEEHRVTHRCDPLIVP
jgi:hypothetical protein